MPNGSGWTGISSRRRYGVEASRSCTSGAVPLCHRAALVADERARAVMLHQAERSGTIIGSVDLTRALVE